MKDFKLEIAKLLNSKVSDLSIEEINAMELLYVPIPVMFGDETYIEGTNISRDEYYDMLENNPLFPTTSQPSPATFLDFFKEAKKNNDEIVAIIVMLFVSIVVIICLNDDATKGGFSNKVITIYLLLIYKFIFIYKTKAWKSDTDFERTDSYRILWKSDWNVFAW